MGERFPLLESLRAERERNEAEITEPMRWQRDAARRRTDEVMRMLTGGIGPEVAEYVKHEAARLLAPRIMEALRDRQLMQELTVSVPLGLALCDIGSLVLREASRVLSEDTVASIESDVVPPYATWLYVRVPAMGCRVELSAEVLENMRLTKRLAEKRESGKVR